VGQNEHRGGAAKTGSVRGRGTSLILQSKGVRVEGKERVGREGSRNRQEGKKNNQP